MLSVVVSDGRGMACGWGQRKIGMGSFYPVMSNQLRRKCCCPEDTWRQVCFKNDALLKGCCPENLCGNQCCPEDKNQEGCFFKNPAKKGCCPEDMCGGECCPGSTREKGSSSDKAAKKQECCPDAICGQECCPEYSKEKDCCGDDSVRKQKGCPEDVCGQECCPEYVMEKDCCSDGIAKKQECCPEDMCGQECCPEDMCGQECCPEYVMEKGCCSVGVAKKQECCPEDMCGQECCPEYAEKGCCPDGVAKKQECCSEDMRGQECCPEYAKEKGCCSDGVVKKQECCPEDMAKRECCPKVSCEREYHTNDTKECGSEKQRDEACGVAVPGRKEYCADDMCSKECCPEGAEIKMRYPKGEYENYCCSEDTGHKGWCNEDAGGKACCPEFEDLGSEYMLRLQASQLKGDNIRVEVRGSMLSIVGGFKGVDQPAVNMTCKIPLDVDCDRILAQQQGGTLSVVLPRAEGRQLTITCLEETKDESSPEEWKLQDLGPAYRISQKARGATTQDICVEIENGKVFVKSNKPNSPWVGAFDLPADASLNSVFMDVVDDQLTIVLQKHTGKKIVLSTHGTMSTPQALLKTDSLEDTPINQEEEQNVMESKLLCQ